MKYLVRFLFFLVVFSLSVYFLTGCGDDEVDNPWEKCYECTADSWLGIYNGTCDYFNYDVNSTKENQPCSVEIEETGTDYFEVRISSPNNFYAVVYGDFATPHMISFSGSTSSVSATMYINGQELRLTGNSKKFHYETPDTIPILVYDEVVNFELFKD